MPHIRSHDEKVDAFSAPKSLINAAVAEAAKRGMTKSGFYRFCLAVELGYSREDALALAEHGSVKRSREALAASIARAVIESASASPDALSDVLIRPGEIVSGKVVTETEAELIRKSVESQVAVLNDAPSESASKSSSPVQQANRRIAYRQIQKSRRSPTSKNP